MRGFGLASAVKRSVFVLWLPVKMAATIDPNLLVPLPATTYPSLLVRVLTLDLVVMSTAIGLQALVVEEEEETAMMVRRVVVSQSMAATERPWRLDLWFRQHRIQERFRSLIETDRKLQVCTDSRILEVWPEQQSRSLLPEKLWRHSRWSS